MRYHQINIKRKFTCGRLHPFQFSLLDINNRYCTPTKQNSVVLGFNRNNNRNGVGNVEISQRREFARSSRSSEETAEEKAINFVKMVGYDDRIAKGVVDALKSSGLSGEALLSMIRTMAGRWEVGEDEGLEALVASVQIELAQSEGKDIIQIYCIPPHAWPSDESDEDVEMTDDAKEEMMKRAFVVEGLEGTTLTDVAKFGDGKGANTLGEYIECACSGIMACSTCHVVIEPKFFEKPCEDEQDMIDLAYSPRKNSRLGCQINLTKRLNGMVVQLPKSANNLMDHIPFE